MDGEKAKSDIELLAKLLSTEKSADNAFFGTERDAFYRILSHEFNDALNNSSIKQSEKIFADIERIADRLELFSYIPELLGKTLVGVFGLNIDAAKRGLTVLVGCQGAETALQDSNLPCVFLSNPAGALAFTDMNHRVDLDEKEYYRTNKVLWRHDIDIRNFLRMFFVKSQVRFPYIGIIYFPQHIHMTDSYNQMLLSKLDACVTVTSTSDSLAQNKLWPHIKCFSQQRGLSCHLIAETINDELALESQTFGIETSTERGWYSLFEGLNTPRYNGGLSEALELPLSKIRKFYEQQLREIADTQKMLVSDLSYIAQEDTQAAVQELSNQTVERKRRLEREQKNLNLAIAELCSKAKIYEKALKDRIDTVSQGETIKECKAISEIRSELFFALLEIPDFSAATSCLRKMKKSGHYFEYVYEMFLQSAQGKTVSAFALNRLRYERETEFVRRAKIRFNRELGFAESYCMRIARDINHLQTADEFYYRGLWEECNNSDFKKAISLYRKSLELGSSMAGKKLMELTKTTSYISMQMLADAMLPEANYALGMEAQQNRKFAKSNRYFKLAAVKGHVLSIKLLTDGIYYSVKKARQPGKKLAIKEQELTDHTIRLYQYVLEHDTNQDINQTEVKERIGDLYHVLGDERRALEYWTQCQTPTAFYNRGRLYQYPDGVFGQDLDEALACFQKASDLGHTKAGDEYNKVLNWKNENTARRIQYEDATAVRNLGTRVVESSRVTKSSGCFITSAVCTALNKPDDCEELMTLRAYRDNIKRNADVGILITEYYRVAPQIVACIDKDVKARDVYHRLWENEISETYKLVKTGKYDEATKCYIKMTVRLCEQYHVELLPEVLSVVRSKWF